MDYDDVYSLFFNVFERAAFDLSTSPFGSVGGVWSELNLNRISQGVDVFARVGRRINVRSVEIKCVLCQGSSGSTLDDPYNVMRVILVFIVALLLIS